ncbi:hypothetical protein DP113_21840 [Brasilonema octagenarum UFV-E1]|uniref:Uncharacterized protein n=1 Tax=Brasilonema sennae CENA114 TaxID=415709 RepID=A0A856MLY9_9CYAN|nr:hypothetical protein [Brasilonema sennae]QDL10197.1 hypothetical protein DP114_21920 [Brasilonema sennae CENA114]QDL16549.1 hypothetical protein DP113_21840 [Brasilonema octagenarum UFV-E1]
MLNIGDYAQHQITGQIGQVIGYGHQILHGVYLTTLKVQANNLQGVENQKKFIEDVYSAWIIADPTQGDMALQA